MDPHELAAAGKQLQTAFFGDLPWEEALQRVAAAAGARGAFLIPLQPGHTVRPASYHVEDAARAYASTHWLHDDFRLNAVGKMLRTGIAVDQDIVAVEAMAKMAYYDDFLGSFGLRWFAGIPFRDGGDVWGLTFQRTPEEGLFNEAEQDMLRRLGCALSQDVSVARRIAVARASGLIDGLEAVGVPAALLDGLGRSLRVNTVASAFADTDLKLKIGQLPSTKAAASARLNRHVSAAVKGDRPVDDPDLRPVVIPREDRRPIVVRARTLSGESLNVFSSARAILLIDDLDRALGPPTDLLRDVFGLTRGQARVAALVAKGANVRECADALAIGVETVRTNLKQVFQRVGVSRQSELVTVLSRLPR